MLEFISSKRVCVRVCVYLCLCRVAVVVLSNFHLQFFWFSFICFVYTFVVVVVVQAASMNSQTARGTYLLTNWTKKVCFYEPLLVWRTN